MAAPDIDINRPVFEDAPVDQDLDQLRDNVVWMLINTALDQGFVPGWTTTVTGGAEPSSVELTQGSVKIRANFTWSGGLPTEIVYQYDKGLGAGLETLTGGTFTPSFDGSGNLTGVTTA